MANSQIQLSFHSGTRGQFPPRASQRAVHIPKLKAISVKNPEEYLPKTSFFSVHRTALELAGYDVTSFRFPSQNFDGKSATGVKDKEKEEHAKGEKSGKLKSKIMAIMALSKLKKLPTLGSYDQTESYMSFMKDNGTLFQDEDECGVDVNGTNEGNSSLKPAGKKEKKPRKFGAVSQLAKLGQRARHSNGAKVSVKDEEDVFVSAHTQHLDNLATLKHRMQEFKRKEKALLERAAESNILAQEDSESTVHVEVDVEAIVNEPMANNSQPDVVQGDVINNGNINTINHESADIIITENDITFDNTLHDQEGLVETTDDIIETITTENVPDTVLNQEEGPFLQRRKLSKSTFKSKTMISLNKKPEITPLVDYLKYIKNNPSAYFSRVSSRTSLDQTWSAMSLIRAGEAFQLGHHGYPNTESIVEKAAYQIRPRFTNADQWRITREVRQQDKKTKKGLKSMMAVNAATAEILETIDQLEVHGQSEFEKICHRLDKWVMTLTTSELNEARGRALAEMN